MTIKISAEEKRILLSACGLPESLQSVVRHPQQVVKLLIRGILDGSLVIVPVEKYRSTIRELSGGITPDE